MRCHTIGETAASDSICVAMALKTVTVPNRRRPIPQSVAGFLRDAEDRVNGPSSRSEDAKLLALCPDDFVAARHAAGGFQIGIWRPGTCSANGAAALELSCTASLLGFDAFGIEIEERLVDENRGIWQRLMDYLSISHSAASFERHVSGDRGYSSRSRSGFRTTRNQPMRNWGSGGRFRHCVCLPVAK